MSELPDLIPIKKTAGQVRNQILENIIKMLTHRELLKENELEQNIKDITKDHPDDMLYKVKTLNGIYPVKFVPQVITTLKKSSVIADFLAAHKDGGLVVVKEIKNSAHVKIYRAYPKVEIFTQNELMTDLKSKVIVPDVFYKIVNSQDPEYQKHLEEFLEEYNCKTVKKLPIMKEYDPMAKYLFCKPGDIVKIVRYSTTSLKTPYYRYIVKSNRNIDTKSV